MDDSDHPEPGLAEASLTDFVPAPVRNRRNGWTPARQRAFILALSRCGSVAAAARQVGMSARGAYALRDRDDAESFAAAWDLAIEMGIDATRASVIDRAMFGSWVPIVRRGRTVRMEFRHFDKLAIGVLSGRGRDVEANRIERARLRAYRKELREADRRRAEEQRRARENADAHRRLWEEAERRVAEREAGKVRSCPPRVRSL